MKKTALINIFATQIDLTIVESGDKEPFAVIEEMSEPLNFVTGNNDSMLTPKKITEAVNIFKMYKTICDTQSVTEIEAFATHSVSNLKNCNSFLEEVYTNCGFKFKISEPSEEIMHTYLGVLNLLESPKTIAVAVNADSINFIQYNRRTIINYASIPVGAFTLAQMFSGSEGTPEEICGRMIEYIINELKALPWLNTIEQEYSFVGVGTTCLNIGKLSRKLRRYPVDIEHNYQMNPEDLSAVYDLVKTLDIDKAKKIKGISSESSSSLASGVCIVKAISDIIKPRSITISEKGLKEGILLSKVSGVTSEKPLPDVLGFSLDGINTFYGSQNSGTKQVSEIALILFRQLKVLHKLGRGYLKVLRTASAMYACGERVRYKTKERSAFNIVLNSDLFGLTQREIILAAFSVAAQDPNEFNLTEWVKYQSILKEEDIVAVKRLAMMVRLAAALDKTHRGAVQDINCDVLGDSVIMKTIITIDAGIEIREAQKLAVDFKKAYNKSLEVL